MLQTSNTTAHTSSMKYFANKTIHFVNCLCLTPLVLSHSIDIYNWNVTRFLQEDGNATAVATLGENITWSLSNGGVWQFLSEQHYYDCFFDDAEEVEGGIYQTWAEGVERNETKQNKGNQYFGSKAGCESGERIKIIVKGKKFKRKNNNLCNGGINIEIEIETSPFWRRWEGIGHKKRCMKICRNIRKCFAMQWTKQMNSMTVIPERTCTLYSNHPRQDGGVGDFEKASCFVVEKRSSSVENEINEPSPATNFPTSSPTAPSVSEAPTEVILFTATMSPGTSAPTTLETTKPPAVFVKSAAPSAPPTVPSASEAPSEVILFTTTMSPGTSAGTTIPETTKPPAVFIKSAAPSAPPTVPSVSEAPSEVITFTATMSPGTSAGTTLPETTKPHAVFIKSAAPSAPPTVPSASEAPTEFILFTTTMSPGISAGTTIPETTKPPAVFIKSAAPSAPPTVFIKSAAPSAPPTVPSVSEAPSEFILFTQTSPPTKTPKATKPPATVSPIKSPKGTKPPATVSPTKTPKASLTKPPKVTEVPTVPTTKSQKGTKPPATASPTNGPRATKPPFLFATTSIPVTKSPKQAPKTSSPTVISFQLFPTMPKTKAPKSLKKDAVTLGPGETNSPTTSAPSKAPKDAAVTLGPGETHSPTTSVPSKAPKDATSTPTKAPEGRRRVSKFNATTINTTNKTPSLVSSLIY